MRKEKRFDFMMAFASYRKLKRKVKRLQDERDEMADKHMIQLSVNKKISMENDKLRKEIRVLKRQLNKKLNEKELNLNGKIY